MLYNDASLIILQLYYVIDFNFSKWSKQLFPGDFVILQHAFSCIICLNKKNSSILVEYTMGWNVKKT